MSPVAVLAAGSALLAAYGLRELARASLPGGVGSLLDHVGGGLRGAAAADLFDGRARLARAGLAQRLSPASLLAARAAGAGTGAALALVAAPADPGRLSWLVLAALPVAGLIAPDALLERSARLRRQRLVAALPDALDLLAVSAATGRGMATTFGEIASAADGPLAVELAVTVAEMSAGVPQQRALAEMRTRVGGSELAALAAAIERSRRFGSPLADQLRRQASALRVDQRRAIEERAARAAPKIQLVVALVLVPSVLLTIAAALIAYSDLLFAGF